jgi:protein SCO1/2
MLCTIGLNGLSAALQVLSFVPGQEFEVLTVSFDPKETPALAAAKKNAYLARYQRPGAEAGWHFLTGSEASIAALTRAAGFRYVWDESTKQFAHPAGLVVATPEGRISHYLFGVEYAPKDLRLALVAAASGRVGNAADQLLLYCYQYDPQAGRYTPSILNVVRALAVLTVLGLVGFMVTASRRHKAKAEPRPAGAPGAR